MTCPRNSSPRPRLNLGTRPAYWWWTGRQGLFHRTFRELPAYLDSGDLLVLNDSRMIPARLRGRRVPTGGQVEVLLLRRQEPGTWEALGRPGASGRAPPSSLKGAESGSRAQIVGEEPSGVRLVRLAPEEALEAWQSLWSSRPGSVLI